MEDKQPPQQLEDSHLDSPDTVVSASNSSVAASESLDTPSANKNNQNGLTDSDKIRFIPKTKLIQKFQDKIKNVNIYLLLFIVVLAIAATLVFINYQNSNKTKDLATINGQELSQEELQKLSSTDQQIGDAKQTLTISSNAVFNGRVLVRENLDVAGTIRVGGALSLPGITVSGTSSFENVQIASNLAITGNTSVQGALAVQQNLTVGGSGNFAGQITAPSISVDRLILNSDLQINRHIDAGGGTPAVSRGGGLGGAGTASLSGTDTAGTVNLNFSPGSSPGTLANITFSAPFSQTPHVVITPIGAACASIGYYINRSTTGFSINANSSGDPSSSCAFDYITID